MGLAQGPHDGKLPVLRIELKTFRMTVQHLSYWTTTAPKEMWQIKASSKRSKPVPALQCFRKQTQRHEDMAHQVWCERIESGLQGTLNPDLSHQRNLTYALLAERTNPNSHVLWTWKVFPEEWGM